MKYIYLFLVFIFSALGALSQSLSLADELEDYSLYLSYESNIDFSDRSTVDSYQYIGTFEVAYNLTINDVLVKNVLSVPLSAEQSSKIEQSSVPSSFEPNVSIGVFRKNAIATVNFIPFIIGSSGIERVVSYEIDVIGSVKTKQKAVTKSASEPSELATGDWYRVKISNDGVYKLSYTFLNDLGVNVGSLNPSSLNVYGHPGGMLAIDNSEYLPGDPQKLAIDFIGDNDENFEDGEYFLFYGEGPHEWNYNEGQSRFEHKKNYFSNYSYFFIRSDDFDPKRINSLSQINENNPLVINSFDEFSFHEVNELNLIKSGRIFFGEIFDANTDQEFIFSTPDLVEDKAVIVRTKKEIRFLYVV